MSFWQAAEYLQLADIVEKVGCCIGWSLLIHCLRMNQEAVR
jgi:hypothetical protein